MVCSCACRCVTRHRPFPRGSRGTLQGNLSRLLSVLVKNEKPSLGQERRVFTSELIGNLGSAIPHNPMMLLEKTSIPQNAVANRSQHQDIAASWSHAARCEPGKGGHALSTIT